MPINGAPSKPSGSVQKPAWLRDEPVQLKNVRPAWAKSKSIAKEDSKSESSDGEKKETPPNIAPTIKKEVKLQSREIKVPLTIEKKVAAPPPLKKPDPKVEQKVEAVVELKKEPKIVVVRNKLPSKSPTPVKSETPSKSPTPNKSSTISSKSTTPSKSLSTTPSKSPSKTPDYTEESDDEDDSDFTEEEETTESDSDTSSEDEVDILEYFK